MRMATFLFGGVVGATTALWMTRNNKPMLQSTMNQAVNAAGRWLNTNLSAQNAGMANTATNANMNSAHESGQISSMINSDPQTKQAVNEILTTNG